MSFQHLDHYLASVRCYSGRMNAGTHKRVGEEENLLGVVVGYETLRSSSKLMQ